MITSIVISGENLIFLYFEDGDYMELKCDPRIVAILKQHEKELEQKE